MGTSKNPVCNAPVIAGMTPQPERNGARRSQSPEFEEMLKQEILKQVQDDVESF